MELNLFSRALFFSLLLLTIFSSFSSSSFLSDAVFESQALATGRNLLQAKKTCPVNFEFMDYKIITDKCKGPTFPTKECCSSLKEFACPYVDELNDLSTDCATTMFSYINLYGKYPPGLFGNQCKEGKEGLECPAMAPSSSADASGANIDATTITSSRVCLIASTALLVLVKLF